MDGDDLGHEFGTKQFGQYLKNTGVSDRDPPARSYRFLIAP